MKKPIAVLPPGAPYAPFEWSENLRAVYALRDLQEGKATPDQQKLALDTIINGLSGYYDISYRPNSARDTDFAEGKRFVGAQIVKLLNLSSSVIESAKKKPPKGD